MPLNKRYVLVGLPGTAATNKMKYLLDSHNIEYVFMNYDEHKVNMIQWNVRKIPVLLTFSGYSLEQSMTLSEFDYGKIQSTM